jgi:hypothetical protein
VHDDGSIAMASMPYRSMTSWPVPGSHAAASTLASSKGDLYAEAVTDVLTEKQLLSSDGVSVDSRAVNNAAQFIRDYLSLEHFEDIDGSCPLIAFPSFAEGAPRSASI